MNSNDTSKISPFKFMYGREPILPLDIILKPRIKYLREKPFETALKEKHKSFLEVHRYLERLRHERDEENRRLSDVEK